MPYPSTTFANLLENTTRAELEQFVALLQGYLSAEHHDDGTHGAVTADSLDVAGDLTVGGDAAIGGNLTANDQFLGLSQRPGSSVADDLIPRLSLGEWNIYGDDTGTSGEDLLFVHSAFDDLGLGSYETLRMRISSGDLLMKGAPLGGDATLDFPVVLGAIFRLGGRTTSSLTGNTNDLAVSSGISRVYLSSNGAYNLTGVASGAEGQLLWVVNNSAFAITLKVNDANSAAGNRFAIANGADVVLRQSNGSVLMHYDTTLGFWFVHGA